MNTDDLLNQIGSSIGSLIMAIIMFLIIGWMVMMLWNLTIPAIFGLPVIGYWRAVGLFILCKILFTGSIISTTDDKDSN